MKSIENLKRQYIEEYARKYFDKEVIELSEKEYNDVKEIAEMGAYINSIIPDGFENYTIFDFNGYAINKKNDTRTSTLSKNVARKAKDKICKYCWGMSWEKVYKQRKEDKDNINSFLKKNSQMMKRSEYGHNIVIYGQSKRPIGRTMLSAIVMKEAFRLRFTNHTISHSYDWVDFSKLFREIERSRLYEDGDTDALTGYKTCDWLVVDNIQKKVRSEKQSMLYSDFLDSFFIGRYEREQPTILVFKFDIRDNFYDFEKTYGTGLSKIIESNRTLRIPLSENLLNNNYYE